MAAINKEKLKEIKNMTLEGIPVKRCPICGGFPELIEHDLGDCYDGYPGDFDYKYRCSKCGVVETEFHSTLYKNGGKNERQSTTKKEVANEWNENVDLINDLITKTRAKETVEDEPEEGTIDEMELTYEGALDILLSHVGSVENEVYVMCKDALEEAIERLRKYERDYANELVDDFMAKTVITGTAEKSAEPPAYPVCPHCNGHHVEQIYNKTTVSANEPAFYSHYKCLDCGKEFYIKKNYIVTN